MPPPRAGAIGLLRRLLPVLRIAFPTARCLGRLDGGFATPEVFAFLEAEAARDSVVALGEHAVLTRFAEPTMAQARALSETRGQTAHGYTEARYAARTYCARGDSENRIKALHHDLAIGRTSCSRFWANPLRVLLTAAADVLMQELRRCAPRTPCARAQVATRRLRLLKLGAHVVVSVRRIVFHLPLSAPDFPTGLALAATRSRRKLER